MPDFDSVYLFSSHMPLLGMPPSKTYIWSAVAGHFVGIDFIPGIHTTVIGCSQVNRDLSQETEVLDPNGDQTYAIEIKYGTAVPMHRCTCSFHKGERVIPAVEFKDGSDFCIPCQIKVWAKQEANAHPKKPIKKKKWYRQLREDGRRKSLSA